MAQRLALSLRPKAFSKLIGQESVVAAIKKIMEKREPPAWMFVGPTGTGKTTMARILAVSLQCTHGGVGEPCEECWKNWHTFMIKEVNASEVSGVEAIGEIADQSVYLPSSPARRNIIILDEAQRLSSAAQNLLLKYFEDAPETTVWMICTTEKNKILTTLRRRCQIIETSKFQAKDIENLVHRAFVTDGRKNDKEKEAKITQAILKVKVQSPGLILNAVENYLAGMPAKESVKNMAVESDSMAVCISLEAGDWNTIRGEIKDLSSDDLRGIRAGVAGYLSKKILEEVPGLKANELALAIDRLAKVDSYTDATQGPATVGVLYELSRMFKGAPPEDDDVDNITRS